LELVEKARPTIWKPVEERAQKRPPPLPSPSPSPSQIQTSPARVPKTRLSAALRWAAQKLRIRSKAHTLKIQPS
jgi:hypothetical protein